MAEVYCGSEPCPLFLNSTCVFYTGESLLYIGVQNNDTLETIIVKINQAFQNAGVGYAFTNGLIQPTPFQPVQLGGALTQNTTIGGNFTLSFSGNVQAAKHITTGGSSSQFVKGDGTLDSTAYQPAANYITGLSGDATASGPGVAVMTLNTVNFSSGTFGNGNTIPIVTVNAKGLVTNITPVPITLPPLPLTFIGDVVGSGFTGSSITLLMQNVNANPYNTITPLKFSVNGKGLVTGASPITASDIVNILGYYPGTSGTSGSDGTSGTSGTTGTSGTSGTSATSGTSGTTGTSGTSATSGTSGTSGTDGTGGTSGTSGSTGTSGTSGTSGTAGTSGTSGTSGSSGSSGTSGSTGTSGSSGTTGTSGSSGTTGTSGSSGTSGTTGTSGSSGTSGTTGLDGTNGTSGTSGTTGTSGSSGTSGTSATSGSSGTSGTTGTSGTSGLSGDRFKTTSTTTYTLQAPGNPGTLTVDPGLAYTVGQSIIIAYDANNHNEAEVTSYDSITGVINFVTFTLTGSGTYSSWFVNIDGASGGDGSSGTSGTTGTSGSSGTSGTTGTSGSSGTSGTSATDGTSGTSGTTGVDGTSGSSGTSGTTGTSGSSGTSGTTGTSGSSGTSGTSATDGTGGTSGTSGSSGTSGTTGTSGTSATSGTSGTSATSGTTGTSGTSGVSGTGGSSGTSGTSATSGTSGTSGATGASGTSGTSGTSVAVSGTTNTMAKFTSSTTIGNSLLTDDGSTLSYVYDVQFQNGKWYTVNNTSGNSTNMYVRPDGNNTYVWRHIYGGSGTGHSTGAGGYGIYNDTLGGDYSAIFNYAGFVTFPYSARSPIFYDSNDTTYYLNPNANGSAALFSNGLVVAGNEGFQSRFYAGGRNRIWSFNNADAYGISYFQGGPDYIGLHFGTPTQAASQFWVSDSGISQTSASSRAPIFYDSNNTGFYFDGASGTNLNYLNVNGTWGSSPFASGHAQLNINGTYPSITQRQTNGSEGYWLHHVDVAGIYHLYGGRGATNGTDWNWSFRAYPNQDGNRVEFRTDVRAPIFYDLDNTTYYINGASTSVLNALNFPSGSSTINTTTPGTSGYQLNFTGQSTPDYAQAITWGWSTSGAQAGIYVQSSGAYGTRMYIATTDSFATGARTAMTINESGIITTTRNYLQATGSLRSPIFYDSDNTGYYLDPTSTTSLRTVGSWRADSSAWDGEFNGKIQYHANSWYFQAAGDWLFRNSAGTNVVSIAQSGRVFYSNYLVSTNSGGLMGDYNVTGTTPKVIWTIGESWPLANMYGLAYEYGSGYEHHLALKNNGTTYSRFGFAGGAFIGGTATAGGDFRAPIFYDSADTGYYLNLNGGSYLYSLILSGNAYFRPSTWIQFDANYGLYWPNSYGAHLYPNTGSSYTQLRLDGNKNGYGGIWDSYSAVAGIMYDSSGNGGVYREANGRWYWYYYIPNDCMGIGTSSTSSSYSLYLNKGVYAQSRIDATIFYDTNDTAFYLDPNSGSQLNGIVTQNYLTASSCALAVTGVGGQITLSSSISTFGSWFRATQHIVIENTIGGYNIYVLDANGVGVVKNAGAQSWSAHSDARIKTVHSTLENNLSKLDGIRPIYYSFNNFDDDRNRIGLIAQEVQEHFPELVDTDPKTNNLTLDYTGLIPVLLGAIKELKTEIETLKTRI